MPKKKTKGAEKEKKTRKKPWLNERETVSYEQQILDNNKELARLRLRNEHLESENEMVKKELSELEENRADVVAHLKRTLQQKTEESRELSDRLLAMEELRKDEQISYKKKEDAMQFEYNTMETNLSAELKLAAGKLNALEDWRLSRIDLMRKFEIQEEQMAEQEERHKKTLYEAEKSMIIDKAKMRKEMEERLNELAQNFREATNIRIADTTHRAVEENIALKLELDATYKVCHELDVKTREHKEKERNLRINSSIIQSEAQMALNKLLEQNRLIDNMAEDHYNMSIAHGKICREEAYKATKEQIVQTYRDKSVEAQQKARILEQNIEKTRKDRDDIVEMMKNDCREIERLESILDTAKRYVTEIAQLQERSCMNDDRACSNHDFEEKLRVLMDILEKQKIIETSVTNDFSMLEAAEYSTESSQVLADDSSVGNMQMEKKHEDPKMRDESEQELIPIIKSQDITTDLNIPQCLLTDSQSSDITSPKETETPRSTNSEDT